MVQFEETDINGREIWKRSCEKIEITQNRSSLMNKLRSNCHLQKCLCKGRNQVTKCRALGDDREEIVQSEETDIKWNG